MRKMLIVIYDTDNDLHGLIVVNPDKTLPNGNKEVIKILCGNYADDIYKELVDG